MAVPAIKLASGESGATTNQQEALRTVAGQPFGKVLLVLVAGGLAGYSLWMLARAATGHGVEKVDSGSDPITAAASGVAYGLRCVTAIEVLVGAGAESGGTKEAAAACSAGPAGPSWSRSPA